MSKSEMLCARVDRELATETRSEAKKRGSSVSAAIRSGLRLILKGGVWEQRAQKELVKAAAKGKMNDVAEVAGMLVAMAPTQTAANKVVQAATHIGDALASAQKSAPASKKAAKKATAKKPAAKKPSKKKPSKKASSKKPAAKKTAAKKAAKKKSGAKKPAHKGAKKAAAQKSSKKGKARAASKAHKGAKKATGKKASKKGKK